MITSFFINMVQNILFYRMLYLPFVVTRFLIKIKDMKKPFSEREIRMNEFVTP